jgi:hypothetical protein
MATAYTPPEVRGNPKFELKDVSPIPGVLTISACAGLEVNPAITPTPMMLSTAERAKALVVREAGRALGLAHMYAVFILRPISSEALSSAKGSENWNLPQK